MAAPIPPAGVSLDIAGTLLFPHPSVGGVYAKVARAHGHQIEASKLDARFPTALQSTRKETSSKERWAEIVERTFAGSIPQSSMASVQAGCWEAFGRGDAWRMARGTLIILTQLRFLGLKIGVLSNADGRMRQVLAEKELLERFDSVMLTDGVSAAKPDPASFGKMAYNLGCKIEQLVHVGDGLEEDARGANACGAHGIWVTEGPAPEGIHRIPRLTALPEAIRDRMLPDSVGKKLTRTGRNLIANLRGHPEEKSRSNERTVRSIDQAVEEAVKRLGIDRPIPEHAISAGWAKLLPPTLARRTAPLRILPDGKLMIQCEGAIVRSEVAFHSRSLLAKIRELPGCGHIKAIGFVVG